MRTNGALRSIEERFPATGPGMGDSTHVELAVSYNAGGMNYFSGGTSARGYYLLVRPVTVEAPTDDGRLGSVSFMMFDDRAFKVFLKPATRFSAKDLAALGVTVKADAARIVALMAEGDRTAAGDVALTLKAA